MTNEAAVRLLEDMYIYRTRKIPTRYKPTKEALKMAVEALQLVGDITRCKDCKHFGTDPKWPICSEHDVETDPTGFCHWAERREE